MRKLLDINTWLALVLEGHSQHALARAWYEKEALAPGELCFCRSTEMGVLRLLTHKKVMEACQLNALSNDQALAFLSQVQQDEVVGSLVEAAGTRALWLALAQATQPSPKIWMDAYLAALAISQELELVTLDQGFLRYQSYGLKLRLLA